MESAEQPAAGTVTLEIPEPAEATKEDGSKTEKVNSSGTGNESKNGKLHASPRKPTSPTADGSTFLSPLIKLFRPKTTKGLKVGGIT